MAGLESGLVRTRRAAISALRDNLAAANGQLLISNLKRLFSLFRSTLLDESWEVVHGTTQLLTDALPELGPDAETYTAVVFPCLVENLGNSEVVIRKATILALSTYLRAAHSASSFISALISSGLENEKNSVRLESTLAIPKLLKAQTSGIDYKSLLAALVGRLNDVDNGVVQAAVLAIGHLNRLSSSSTQQAVRSLPLPMRQLYMKHEDEIANPALQMANNLSSPPDNDRSPHSNPTLVPRRSRPSSRVSRGSRTSQRAPAADDSDDIVDRIITSHTSTGSSRISVSGRSSTPPDWPPPKLTKAANGLYFGFITPELAERLQSEWRVRGAAVESLQAAVANLDNTAAVLPTLKPFLHYLTTSLLPDTNFKVTTAAFNILSDLIGKVGLSIKPHLHTLVPALTESLSDKSVLTRQSVFRTLHKLSTIVTPKPVLALLTPAASHESWHVRCEVLNLYSSAILSFRKFDFDYAAMVPTVVASLSDPNPRVSETALETCAVIHSAIGHRMATMYPDSTPDSVLQILSARLNDPNLPSVSSEGLLDHVNPSLSSTSSLRSSITSPPSSPRSHDRVARRRSMASNSSIRTQPARDADDGDVDDVMDLITNLPSARQYSSSRRTAPPSPQTRHTGRPSFSGSSSRRKGSAASTGSTSMDSLGSGRTNSSAGRPPWDTEPRRRLSRSGTRPSTSVDGSSGTSSHEMMERPRVSSAGSAGSRSGYRASYQDAIGSFSTGSSGSGYVPSVKGSRRPRHSIGSNDTNSSVGTPVRVVIPGSLLTPSRGGKGATWSGSEKRDWLFEKPSDVPESSRPGSGGPRTGSRPHSDSSLPAVSDNARTPAKVRVKMKDVTPILPRKQPMKATPVPSKSVESSPARVQRGPVKVPRRSSRSASPAPSRELARTPPGEREDSDEAMPEEEPATAPTRRPSRPRGASPFGSRPGSRSRPSSGRSVGSARLTSRTPIPDEEVPEPTPSSNSPDGPPPPPREITSSPPIASSYIAEVQSKVDAGMDIEDAVSTPAKIPEHLDDMPTEGMSTPQFAHRVGSGSKRLSNATLKRLQSDRSMKASDTGNSGSSVLPSVAEGEIVADPSSVNGSFASTGSTGSRNPRRPVQSAPVHRKSPSTSVSSGRKGSETARPSLGGFGGSKVSVVTKSGGGLMIASEDLQPLGSNPDNELTKALKLLDGNSEQWEQHVGAVTTLRRIALFHSQSLIDAGLHSVVVKLCASADNLRSAVSRASVVAVADFCSGLGKSMDSELDYMVPRILKKSGESNTFIQEEVMKSMSVTMQSCTDSRCLMAFMTAATNYKAAVIRAKAVSCMAQVLGLMGSRIASCREIEKVLPALAKFLSEGNPEIRNSAKAGLARICDAHGGLGSSNWDRLLSRHTSGSSTGTVREMLTKMQSRGEWPSGDLVSLAGSSFGAVPPSPGSRRSTTTRRISSMSHRSTGSSLASTAPARSTGAVTSTGSATRSRRSASVSVAGSRRRAASSSAGRRRATSVGASGNVGSVSGLAGALAKLDDRDWKTRLNGIDALVAAVSGGTPVNVWGVTQKVFDRFTPRLQDNNAKVNLKAVETLPVLIPSFGNALDASLAVVVPALAANLASNTSKIVKLTQECFTALGDHVDAAMLISHYSSVVMYGTKRQIAPMLEEVAVLSGTVISRKPALIVRHVVPMLNKYAKERRAEVKQGVECILNGMHDAVGEDMWTHLTDLQEDVRQQCRAMIEG